MQTTTLEEIQQRELQERTTLQRALRFQAEHTELATAQTARYLGERLRELDRSIAQRAGELALAAAPAAARPLHRAA